jgi:hypothetical protein
VFIRERAFSFFGGGGERCHGLLLAKGLYLNLTWLLLSFNKHFFIHLSLLCSLLLNLVLMSSATCR